jgi:gamma-glutamyltranspeptidase/glutathione hydrolase
MPPCQRCNRHHVEGTAARQLNRSTFFLTVALAATVTGCAGRASSAHPEQVPPVAGVSAANPYAVDAGLAVLEAGGSAVDAAVAVQAMLGLVEPQSSGIAGGAFLMYYDARSSRVRVWDGREVAPRAVNPRQFLDSLGNPLPQDTVVVGGIATGVPGVMPMLGVVHGIAGKLPWSELFGDAIAKAEQGFVVPRRLGTFANGRSVQAAQPDVRALFWNAEAGRTIRPGETHRNAPYGASLRALASRGPRALHEGPIADSIIARLSRGARPSTMTRADLAAYQPVERTPLCAPYRALTVCVPPPPSSGVSMLQLLAMLDRTDVHARGPDDPRSWLLFAEASRMMYADRDRYVADPGFVDVPVAGMLNAEYVAARAATIGARAGERPTAGVIATTPRGEDAGYEEQGTTHFVIIDFEGNVVSMTTTVESVFGSGRVVGGFILNNQLTDFSFRPDVDGIPVANAIAPGKRPRSSMAPTIVLDPDGRFRAAIGSPGGSNILIYNAKLALGLLGWGLPVQTAIDLPNLSARDPRLSGEINRMSTIMRDSLTALGLPLLSMEGEDSGLHGIIIRGPGRLEGGADPRRDGVWRATVKRAPR